MDISINSEKSSITFKIYNNELVIDRQFIYNKISQNFTVEMFYYVLCEFKKYNNYKITINDNNYIFEGYYNEPYDQGDQIYIKLTFVQ
jgi:hypothetical protein